MIVETAELLAWTRLATLLGLRLAPVVALSPLFGLRSAPVLVRTALVLVLTIGLLPLAHDGQAASAHASPYAAAAVHELLIGFLFATAVSGTFHAVEFGGRLVDLGRGANVAEVLAPPTGERTSPSSDLVLLAALAGFAAAGGPSTTLFVFGTGLRTIPLGEVPTAGPALALEVATVLGGALTFGVLVGTPALLSVLLADTAFGLVGRAVPVLSAHFAAMPVRGLVGSFALLVSLAVVLGEVLPRFGASLGFARHAILGG